MREKNILLVGFLGYKTNQLDGQTIKTRNVYHMLNNHIDKGKLNFFDTQELHISKYKILALIKQLFLCNKLVLIPAGNGLRVILPIAFLISLINKMDIILIPVGGWLSWYIESRPMLKYILSKTSAILPQTQLEASILSEKYKFKNVQVLNNFRIHNYNPEPSIREEKMRLVFFSRIHKMKGLDIVFFIADFLKENAFENITIDFYGPINEEDKKYFEENLLKYNFVTYHGVLQPELIYETLSDYDLLLLPTKYLNDEGFPGAILDAYISGVPVLVSEWRHSREFVEEGVSGFIRDINEPSKFSEAIMELYSNPKLLFSLKKGALKKAEIYSETNAWKVINQYL